MPLVANSDLPSFTRLRAQGELILEQQQATHQDIRELHIGLLNMMPDKALAATERQFFRLIGGSNQIAQFYVHPFTLQALPRSSEGQQHVQRYYSSFREIQAQGLDALIITGANVLGRQLCDEPFWSPLIEVVDWAWEHVTSTLCSCLASHAVIEFRYQQQRRPLPAKRWGVFPHRVVDRNHPLVSGVNTRFDTPHSRYNDISPEQFARAGLRTLVVSDQGEVHLAVSNDGLRQVFFQAHPEYDSVSLMKEYKREVGRYIRGERPDYPPLPEKYFPLGSQALLEEYRLRIEDSRRCGQPPDIFPEHLLVTRLDNTWHDTAGAIMNNWLGLVYQLTDLDRQRPFRAGVDSNNPLGLLASGAKQPDKPV